jgi:hypothetical protein
MDPLVKVIEAQSVTGFDPKTLLPVRVTQWKFLVGPHGPFVRTTPDHDFTPEYVAAETQKVVDTLRATGAIPAS